MRNRPTLLVKLKFSCCQQNVLANLLVKKSSKQLFSWNGVNIFEVRNSGRDSKRQAIYDLFHCLIYWVTMWKTEKWLVPKTVAYLVEHLFNAKKLSHPNDNGIFYREVIFHTFYVNIWPAIKLHYFIVLFNRLMIFLFCLWYLLFKPDNFLRFFFSRFLILISYKLVVPFHGKL